MPTTHEIRAAQSKALLAAVRDQPAGVRDDILARFPREDVEWLDGSLGLGWAAMELHMRLSDAIREVVGPDRNVEIWRATMGAVFAGPVLRGFVDLTTGLFGLSPIALLRRAETVYEHITRQLGRLTVEGKEPDRCTVTLSGFPSRSYQFVCYVEGLRGCLLSCFDVCRASGDVTVDHVDDARGHVRYDARLIR